MSKITIVIFVCAALAFAAPAPTVNELKTPAGADSGQPNLAVGADGRVVLSWIEPGQNGDVLKFSTRGPQGWSAPKTIAQGKNWFVSDADVPSMAVLSDGTLAAHWFVKPAGVGPESEAYDINLSFSKDGGATWSKPMMPHHDGKKRQHGFVSLMPTADAKLAAIWLDGRNMASEEEGDMALMYTTIAPNGTVAPEVQVDKRTCECCKTSMAATTPGGLIAVYRDRSDKEIRDIAVTRFANGKWSPPQIISNDGWEIDGCPINGPAVSSNGKNVAVVWFTAPDDKPQVYAVLSTDGGATFGKKIRIDEGKSQGRVDIASRANGGAVVAWVERGAKGNEVRIREIAPNGTPAAPMNVSGSTGLSSGAFPRMVRSGEEMVVAWTDASSQVRTAIVK